MVIVLFPANTPESVKQNMGKLIDEITRDMSPEQFRQFEREWNESELISPLFVKFKHKPHDAIRYNEQKRTTKRSSTTKGKPKKRAMYEDLSKKPKPRAPLSTVVRIRADGRVVPVAKYRYRLSVGGGMTSQDFKDALYDAYVEALTAKIDTGYFVNLPGEPEPRESDIRVIAVKMFYNFEDGIRKGLKTDYLAHNPALKEACARFGIRTSPDFRNAWRNGIGLESDQYTPTITKNKRRTKARAAKKK